MPSSAEIEAALRHALPAEAHATIPALAQLLAGISTGAVSPAQARADLEATPGLADALRALSGQDLRASDAVLSFGAGSQTGDVTISGDIAGGDIYQITINASGDVDHDRLARQIDELYGPLASALAESQRRFEILCRLLPTSDGRIDMGRFSQKDSETWNYFTESYFLPLNAKMTALISAHRQLIEGDALPRSFEQFLDHAAQFDSLHRLWRERGIDTSHLAAAQASTAWPADFQPEVEATLARLRALRRQQAGE